MLGIWTSCGTKAESYSHTTQTSIEVDTLQTPTDTIDRSSLLGVHKYVLSQTCTYSGCHDGHFEPDFRTVQSSYSTLVYQPILKNNAKEEFQYRVIPFDTARSVLYERITNCCFVNQDDRMPQSTIGEPLAQKDIDAVGQWIMEGAKDIFGESSKAPEENLQ